MSELDYDIQELYIEGYSPVSIAAMLNCPLETVYDWLEDNNVAEKQQEEYDPFNTSNS
jgi:DNA-directed RNA polymerase specialized sigma24 family protein